MIDGFLLFSTLDVWRMILPLGLTWVVGLTEFYQWWKGRPIEEGLAGVLGALTLCVASSLLIMSAVAGLLVPLLLGHPVPESHIASGPWGYEEMLGYAAGVFCLWRSRQASALTRRMVRLGWTGCAAGLFLIVGVLWLGRWDAMAHGADLRDGWFLPLVPSLTWAGLIPKTWHLFFSGLTAAGCLVTLLGLTGYMYSKPPTSGSGPARRSATLRFGIGWILSGLVPQVFIGPWVFLVLDDAPRVMLIDGAGLPSLLFFLSVTVAFLALVLLNASFMAPHVQGLVWGGISMILLTLVLMGIIRHMVFVHTLQGQGIPMALEMVTPFHLLTVLIFTGLLGAILFRWCLWPGSSPEFRAGGPRTLDKPFTAN